MTRHGGTYSARGAMAAALQAFQAAERERIEAEQRAASTHGAALKQATDTRDRAMKTARAHTAAAHDQLDRLVANVDIHLREADQALAQAGLMPPVPIPPPSSQGRTATMAPDQAVQTSYNDFVDAYNNLAHALQELERVRGTLLVRAMRKIGLPPI